MNSKHHHHSGSTTGTSSYMMLIILYSTIVLLLTTSLSFDHHHHKDHHHQSDSTTSTRTRTVSFFVSSFTSSPKRVLLFHPSSLLFVKQSSTRTINTRSTSTQDVVLLYQSSSSSQQPQNEVSSSNNNNNNNNNNNKNENELSVLQTRKAIMEHALQSKINELETFNNRNILLQDVVKKLQISNRNLMDKIHELQHEKEGMHISTESISSTSSSSSTQEEQVWPPEMEIQILRQQYNTQEETWKNAIETAHMKYIKLRDDHYDVHMRLREVMEQLQESEDKIIYLEEKSKIDEIEIEGLRDEIEEKMSIITEEDTSSGEVLENKVKELQTQVDTLEQQNENTEKDLEETKRINGNLKSQVLDLEGMVAKLEEQNASVKEVVEKEKKNDNEEMKSKVLELEAMIVKLEEQNDSAKRYIQEITDSSRKKREEIQHVVMIEKRKNDNVAKELKSTQAHNVELKEELDKVIKELESVHMEINLKSEQSERQKDEEYRAKQFSKESLDIATAAVRQAEVREIELKKKLSKANKKLDDMKEENISLMEQVANLKASIENAMEQHDENLKLLAVESDWKLQVDDLKKQLEQTRSSRDELNRQDMGLRRAFIDSEERHKVQLESIRTEWEDKFETQKMECSSLAHQLKTEIMTLNNNIIAQERKIKTLVEERDSLKLVVEGSHTVENSNSADNEVIQSNDHEINTSAGHVDTDLVPTNNTEEIKTTSTDDKPRRFRRIRNQLGKMKNVFRRGRA